MGAASTLTQWILAAMVALTAVFLLRRFGNRRAELARLQNAEPDDIVIKWDKGPPGQITVQDWMAAPETHFSRWHGPPFTGSPSE